MAAVPGDAIARPEPASAATARSVDGALVWRLAPVVCAVAAGAALRLAEPDLVLFKFDEATASRQVVHMLRTHVPVASGTISSVGGAFPSMFAYASGASHLAVVVQQGADGGPGGALRSLDVPLANGVRYVGWSITQPNPRLLRVTLGWRLADHPDTAVTDVPYVHLLRGDQMVAQHDGAPYPSSRWQAGQVLYAWFDLPLSASLPSGLYELRTGMYAQPGVRRIPRLGPSGPEDGEFSLGTVTVGG